MLDPNDSVLNAILKVQSMPVSKARGLLGSYLFSGDTIEKPIGMLSGGERGRVALAVLSLEGANVLLLDEPTNHLDLDSQEVLQDALADFEGTLLLVTHDRYLVDALATHVWAIEENRLVAYEGNYSEFIAQREEAKLRADAASQNSRASRQRQAQDQTRCRQKRETTAETHRRTGSSHRRTRDASERTDAAD